VDANDPTFQEFRAYWQLSEEMIADATKEDLAEAARIPVGAVDIARAA
jgi:hypothetical protein